jgi:type IV pilus assembly protein PilB
MILRLNPDIVFVGEIRDAETAKIAIQASLTGHLVISTVHGRNSIGALYRMMDLGVDKYMLNYALRAIVSQRLLRRVCDHCKEEYHPSPEELEAYKVERGSNTPLGQVWHGKGCEWCHNSRYKGRVGIYELLEMNEDARELVFSGVDEAQFRAELVRKGYKGINQEGVRLVEEGITSLREYLRTMYDAR